MSEKQTIYCAGCYRAIGTYDGRSTINKTIRCSNCGKYNLFRVNAGKTEITEKPQRVCASGVTFF